MSTTLTDPLVQERSSVWLDVAAFAGGLAIAWWAQWKTTDLVWSLWLSSLVVGYALIVWTITASAREFTINAVRDSTPGTTSMKAGAGALVGVGLLFSLVFFAVHFGGFHYVHSVFLSMFFPITTDGSVSQGFPGLATYVEIFRRYWIFLPVAFLAERAAFQQRRPGSEDATIVRAEAITRRKQTSAGNMMAPYKNVVRMHLLIFFFVAAHFMRLENFLVYAVVYAVYFFPWRLLKRQEVKAATP